MKSKFAMSFAPVVGLLLVCGPVFAHHGNSSYDDKNPIALKATVTQFLWSNPHSVLFFDVKDDKGDVVHWTAETLAPGRLSRAGWSKDAVKAGDQVTVILMPAKNGAPLGHFHELIFSDGRKLDVGEECLYCPANPNFKGEAKQQ
jgi:hypothetical protein